MKSNKQKQLRVAYVIYAYPTLHKTYVDREILMLKQMGVDIRIYSLHRRPMKLSPYQQELSKSVIFVNELKEGMGFRANVKMLLRYPWRYISTFLYLMFSSYPNLMLRLKTARHFIQGQFLSWLLLQDPPDHIHAHFLNKSATEALVAHRMTGIPYSVEVHASAELFVHPFLITKKLGDSKFISTCTRYNKEYLDKMDSRIGMKSHVIYHGIDPNKYRRSSPPRSSCPLIVSVGQLVERKGYPVLVDACKILRDSGVEFECLIVGEGPMRPALEAQILSAGLEKHVRLTGALPQDDIIPLYEQATVSVLAAVLANDGDRDGIPNVILESMAVETPVISTSHLAIPEVIEDGVNGLLVPPNDPQALASAIRRVFKDKALHNRLAAESRKTVLEKFNPEKNAKRLLDVMQQG